MTPTHLIGKIASGFRSGQPDVTPRSEAVADHSCPHGDALGTRSSNGVSFLQFSFQQGGWGASLADKLVR